MQPVQASRIIRFDRFEVNLTTGELRKAGVLIRLQAQPFQILAVLLEQPGRLITREVLRSRLWSGNTFVDFEKSLTIAIGKLRQALSDSAGKPRFIETLPRRGYRFIGAVELRDEAGEIVGLPSGSAADRTVSHYRLIEKLGEGGVGVVYKAEDMKLKRNVALKFLASHLTRDSQARQRFLREAQAAAAVDHPNLCTVYEIGDAAGQIFIAMAYVEGLSLAKKIEAGPLEIAEAFQIATQAAQGLHAAHEKGIVHRDVKSANLMVTPDGLVKILDFGLAQLINRSRLTQSGTSLGTPTSMSPEQAQRQPTDHRTDIWSLRALIYEMVTGRLPFDGECEDAVLHAIVHEDPIPMTALRVGVPIALDRIVGKALSKKPTDRYQHAEELVVDIRGLERAFPESTVSRQGTSSGREVQVRRHRLLGAMVAGLSVALALVSFVHFTELPPDRPVRRHSFTPDSFKSHYMGAVVSPDGRSIVYVSNEDPASLWLRSVESEEPRRLDGTVGTLWGPFWSPDSRFVAFAAEGRLKKVAIDGGQTVALCELPGSNWDSGAWSPDGERIVFSSGPAAPQLYEVPARGGQARRLFEATQGEKGSGSGQPRFLPRETGIEALLFSGGAFTRRDLYVTNLETGKTVKLTEGARPLYSPTGHIVYQTGPFGSGLWALPFSTDNLEVKGEPFPIAYGVGSPSLATDGTLVAVDMMGGSGRRLVWRDRKGGKLGEIGRPQASIAHPALSPDGRFVAVDVREQDEGSSDIWLHELGRAVSQRLTFDRGSEQLPAWSPSGREVTFYSDRQGAGHLFWRRIDQTGDAELLAGPTTMLATSAWSPDGHLIYSASNLETGFDLWLQIRRTDGKRGESKPFLATPFNEDSPQISPGGRYLAYCSDKSGSYEVYVQEFPSGEGLWQVSDLGGCQPRWSRDGREIFYVEGNFLVAVAVNVNPSFQVGQAQRLFTDASLAGLRWTYDVAPDGRFVMVEAIAAEEGEQRKPAIRITENWYEEFRDR